MINFISGLLETKTTFAVINTLVYRGTDWFSSVKVVNSALDLKGERSKMLTISLCDEYRAEPITILHDSWAKASKDLVAISQAHNNRTTKLDCTILYTNGDTYSCLVKLGGPESATNLGEEILASIATSLASDLITEEKKKSILSWLETHEVKMDIL